MSNDFNDFMNTPDDTGMYDTQDIQTNKVWAALSYVGILFILPLLVNGGQSRYAKYHANQGFILFLTNIVVGIASAILGKIPVLGAVLSALLSLASLALMIIGIINAANGKAKQLPLIGGLFHVFDK
ncbi:DUF4870 domain-containing protein [uncultured Ruminococcus sp.]|jgi:uncharacterized membrane protein|uniref:DUF4870 domain-containing protein n=1 Tax=uncultured Ruminococcus sp. TaxID=165186 RepID=UPI0025CBE612|nr:DUF4870 domain-containing protein [uncultured Ruminococcus sp.]